MKLYFSVIGTLHAYSSPFGELNGCNPADLQDYELTSDCKNSKGFNTQRDDNGIFLEKRSNYCRRKCKYNDQRTAHVQCRCERNNVDGTWDCSYKMKLIRKGYPKQWLSFDHQENGDYPVDKWGYGGRQSGCVPSTIGVYGQWSQWSECDGSCGLGWQVRTRECAADSCGSEPAEEVRRCVSYANYEYTNPYDNPVAHSVCRNPNNTPKYYYGFYTAFTDFDPINEGRHCVFPSFGKGWHEETIDGELVQMGVECEGDETWNYDTYTIARPDSKCNVVCRGQNGGQFLPETNEQMKFTCRKPIPVQRINPDNGFSQWLDEGLGIFGPSWESSYQNNQIYLHYYYNWQLGCSVWDYEGCKSALMGKAQFFKIAPMSSHFDQYCHVHFKAKNQDFERVFKPTIVF